MDAVFLVMMGVGGYLMWAAYDATKKGQPITPVASAKALLGTASTTGG